MQEERALAGHVTGVEHVGEHVLAALERVEEPLLLAAHHGRDEVVLRLELGVGRAHGRDGRVDERRA